MHRDQERNSDGIVAETHIPIFDQKWDLIMENVGAQMIDGVANGLHSLHLSSMWKSSNDLMILVSARLGISFVEIMPLAHPSMLSKHHSIPMKCSRQCLRGRLRFCALCHPSIIISVPNPPLPGPKPRALPSYLVNGSSPRHGSQRARGRANLTSSIRSTYARHNL
jgi:hypothetical protein